MPQLTSPYSQSPDSITTPIPQPSQEALDIGSIGPERVNIQGMDFSMPPFESARVSSVNPQIQQQDQQIVQQKPEVQSEVEYTDPSEAIKASAKAMGLTFKEDEVKPVDFTNFKLPAVRATKDLVPTPMGDFLTSSPSDFEKFGNKEIEFRYSNEGGVEYKDPKSKKWDLISNSETASNVFDNYMEDINTAVNLPANTAMTAASLALGGVPGMIGRSMTPVFSGFMQTLKSPGLWYKLGSSAAVGTTGYTTQEGSYGESLAKALYPPELVDVFLKSGRKQSPVMTGLVGAGGEFVGGIIEGFAARKERAMQTSGKIAGAASEALGQAQIAEREAAKLGIELPVQELVSELPGGELMSHAFAKLGNDARYTAIANKERQRKLQTVLTASDMLRKTIGANIARDDLTITKSVPITRAINERLPEGRKIGIGNRINVVDRLMIKQQREHEALVSKAIEQTGNRQVVDPEPIIAQFHAEMRKYVPEAFDANGEFNEAKFFQAMKDTNPELDAPLRGAFLNAYKKLNRSVQRTTGAIGEVIEEVTRDVPLVSMSTQEQLPFIPIKKTSVNFPTFDSWLQLSKTDPKTEQQMIDAYATWEHQRSTFAAARSLIPNSSVSSSGASSNITLQELMNFTNLLQELANTDKVQGSFKKALSNVAYSSRMLEDGIITKVFTDKGKPELAQQILKSKEKYALTMPVLNELKQTVGDNLEVIGQTILDFPTSKTNFVLDVMSDNQKTQLKSAILEDIISETIQKDNSYGNRVTGINAGKILRDYLAESNPAAKNRLENMKLVFGKDLDVLESFLKKAAVFERKASKLSTSGMEKELENVFNELRDLGALNSIPFFRSVIKALQPIDDPVAAELWTLKASQFLEKMDKKNALGKNTLEMLSIKEKIARGVRKARVLSVPAAIALKPGYQRTEVKPLDALRSRDNNK